MLTGLSKEGTAVGDRLQRWYASMKRARISLRARQVAMTTAAVAVLLYLWDWLVYGLVLGGPAFARLARVRPVSPVGEALVDLLVAFLFALLFETRQQRASVGGGAIFGLVVGVLVHVPAPLLGPAPGPPLAAELVLAYRAAPGVVALVLAGVIAALVHRRED